MSARPQTDTALRETDVFFLSALPKCGTRELMITGSCRAVELQRSHHGAALHWNPVKDERHVPGAHLVLMEP